MRTRRLARYLFSGGATLLIAGIALAVASRQGTLAREEQCLANLRQLGLAARLYTADWDRLPLADSWCDAALPYAEARPGEETLEGVGGSFVLTGRQLGLSDGSVRTYFGTGYPDREEWEEKYAAITGPELLKCPEARSAECGYAFNSALSGLSEGAVSEPSRVVLLFESDARWNATGGESSIAWGRHPRAGSDSAIVVFFDGSASPRTRAELASSEAWQAAD